MQNLINFFNHPFFIIIGGLAVSISVLGSLYTLYLILRGILPLWYRLGRSLTSRKIAILADTRFNELKDVLVDSSMFREKNIVQIEGAALRKAARFSFYLVHYAAWKDHISEVLAIKKDSDAMILYAPQDEGAVDQDILNQVNTQRNTIIVNFRGRLLNDVLVSMITTSFAK